MTRAGLLSYEDIQSFVRDGYLYLENLLSPEETELITRIARKDAELAAIATDRLDAAGGMTRLALRNELADADADVYSALVRSRRIVERMEEFLGGEVYHYHHKVSMKEPGGGGAWEWHQDYGYWYGNGCLFPLMASCLIALDPCTRENGCLQVIRGSHHMGRIEHGAVGGQTGADPDRVNAVLERLPLDYCEMKPGAGLFFHSNLLHRSDANNSPIPRWVFIACYNAARNDPYRDGPHPRYSPLAKVSDSAVLETANAHWERLCEAT